MKEKKQNRVNLDQMLLLISAAVKCSVDRKECVYRTKLKFHEE